VDHEIQFQGYVQFEYVHEELKDIFSITDFVLSRAGSNAIFEFLALRIPMLLIPLSLQASRGDQIDNAKSFANKGFAHVLQESDLTEERLTKEMLKLKEYGSMLIDKMTAFESEKTRDHVIELIKKYQKQK